MNQDMKHSAHRVSLEQLMVFLDGELPGEETTLVAEHLSECVQCQMNAVEFSEASAKMQAWRVEAAPEAMEMGPRLSAALDEVTASRDGAAPKPDHGFGRALLALVTLQWIGPVWVRGLAFGLGSVVVLMVALVSTSQVQRAPQYARVSAQMAAPASIGQDELMAPGQSRSRLIAPPQERASGDVVSSGFATKVQEPSDSVLPQPVEVASPRMLVRTAQLVVTTKRFEQSRAQMDLVLAKYQGYVGRLNVTSPPDAGRVLSASLRIPADRMDAAMAELKKLGRVDAESVNADEITQQYVDLSARLINSRKTEQRLNELMLARTGKPSDLVEVERYRSQTREEIERMEAEKKSLEGQVRFSAIQLTVNEEYKAQLPNGRSSSDNKLWNAAIAGYTGLVETTVGIATFVLIAGPTILLWCVLLGVPAYFAWRKWLRGRPKLG
jgi:anti-sigma factor RsiW